MILVQFRSNNCIQFINCKIITVFWNVAECRRVDVSKKSCGFIWNFDRVYVYRIIRHCIPLHNCRHPPVIGMSYTYNYSTLSADVQDPCSTFAGWTPSARAGRHPIKIQSYRPGVVTLALRGSLRHSRGLRQIGGPKRVGGGMRVHWTSGIM